MAITYSPSTNFGAKDTLPASDPNRVVKGAEFSTEFDNISVSFGLAAPAASPTFTGTATFAAVDINSGAIDNTVIGGTTPAAVSGTTGTFSGAVTGSNLNVSNWDTAYGWGDHAAAGYLTSYTETNDLTAAVTWANVPDANITQSSVTQHQAALTITQSQISDLDHYTDADVDTHLNTSTATSGQVLSWTGADYDWIAVSGTGTVTSVGMNVPTGLTVTGVPITTGGTIEVSYDTGYAIPTTAKQTQWDTAYGWGDHSVEGYITATTASVVTVGGLISNGEIEEQQYSLTGTVIDPANGTIQYKTLSANTTFTESLADGEYVTLMIDDGTGYTITWPTMTWVGGSAPTLETTGYNVIEIWQVNGTLYGAFVGAA